MWQVRRGLNILHGATPETLKDLFATTSEVEKMDGMVQTLQSMLAVIEARKTVVEQREAARLAEAAVPAVQGTLSSFLLKPGSSDSSYLDLGGCDGRSRSISAEEGRAPKRETNEQGPSGWCD